MTQITLPDHRVYRVDDGQHAGLVLPSITTILGARPKPGIERWKKRQGDVKAEHIKVQAAIKGSIFHDALEKYLDNLPVGALPLTARDLWRYIAPWLDKHVTAVLRQETNVYSYRLSVAGRFDVLCYIDGKLSVFDLKGSKKPKKEEYVQDYYLQGTFYAAAVFELTGLIPEQIVIPVVSPDDFQVFQCKPMDHFDELLARIDEYYDKYFDPQMTTVPPDANVST